MLYCVFPVGHVTQDVGINDDWAVYKRQATATKGSKHVTDNYKVSHYRGALITRNYHSYLIDVHDMTNKRP